MAQYTQISTFSSPDIECEGCANSIKKALGNLPGVVIVAVNVEDKKVAVTHEPSTASADFLIQALDKAGFTSTLDA